MSRAAISIAVILCAALLWLSPHGAWAKPPAGIKIDAAVGYDGMVQLSRVNPVVVDIENTSQALNLSGDLVLSYNDVEYTTKLELPTPSKKRFFLYFPCDSYPPTLTLIVRTKAYTEQFTLSALYKTVDSVDFSILVLTQQSGSLGVINQLPGVRLFRDVYQYKTTQLGSSKTFVSYADLSEIDPNPKYFSRADTIVLADIDYQQVTPELAAALKACVAGGTNVIFSLGLNQAAVMASPLADLCPLRCSGTVQLGDLGNFGQRYHIDTKGAQSTFAVGQPVPGAEVHESAGRYPAVVSKQQGSGIVTALAFDVTAVPFKQNSALAPLFVDNALTVSNSVVVTNWFIHPENVKNVLSRFREGRPMMPSFVLLFLVLYIVLIGPANFLILSRLKRRTLVWTTIPLIILGFSYLGMATGYIYRGSSNVTAYFQELHLFPGEAYAPYQTVMLLFTAERTTYKLEVPDASAFLYADLPEAIETRFGGNPGGGMRGIFGGRIDNSKLPTVDATQGKWTSKNYYYQGYLGLQASVNAELAAFRVNQGLAQLVGTVTLDLPFDLYDCYLFDGQSSKHLGNVAGKGSFALWSQMGSPAGELNPDNYLVAQRSELGSQQQQASRLGQRYRDEVLLVGFTEQIEAQAKFDRPHNEHCLTMVVLHLPVKVSIANTGKPGVVRTRITGGAGFEVNEPYYGYGYQAADTDRLSYRLQANGYINACYEVGGELSSSPHLLLHMEGLSGTNREPLTDMAGWLAVDAWDGKQWQEVDIKPNEMVLDVPIGGLLDNKRQVNLRFRAIGEFFMQIPWADVY